MCRLYSITFMNTNLHLTMETLFFNWYIFLCIYYNTVLFCFSIFTLFCLFYLRKLLIKYYEWKKSNALSIQRLKEKLNHHYVEYNQCQSSKIYNDTLSNIFKILKTDTFPSTLLSEICFCFFYKKLIFIWQKKAKDLKKSSSKKG